MRPTREAWLTKKELADALKVSVRTIERERIPYDVRIAGMNRYYLSQVRAFLRGELAENPPSASKSDRA